MNYSPLAVHCVSLCCDIMQNPQFQTLSHDEIDHFYQEVVELIKTRTEVWSHYHSNQPEFVDSVALGVIKALHMMKKRPEARDATWLLAAMQSRIDSSLKMHS
ncbi:hypothetical protein HGP28_15210 [Vibrio sp. SM6]|uniref:Uncharacterized protein n=1 Tax=Vibrio agarilyticus TaxID=2726741 RepID=A0A7X8TSS8_9VIBR|nr:hypothetical protein [Vibrio agarilyticus]NLS14232.1 hypothetical protein [Vibrio agarilyticus]